ncbi:MAG: Alanine--tRNA ligase, partial [Pelotomaculum thermopropionicum]
EETGETNFVGYESLEAEAKVMEIIKNGERVNSAGTGEKVEFVLDVTPCYAESGGQVSDHGKLTASGIEVEIFKVTKPIENLFVHRGKIIKGSLKKHGRVLVQADRSRRTAVCRNHTATHLLHKALREVLGDHINQAGSLVDPERLRFDFTHFTAVTAEELQKVESVVNNTILSNLPVEAFETSLDEARAMGAAALFGEKYGERVRIIKIGEFSLELCGGTHLKSTAEAGLFKLAGESSVGAGLRRVEAFTGENALRHVKAMEEQLDQIARMVKAAPREAPGRVEGLLQEIKELEAENEVLQAQLAKHQVQDLAGRVKEVRGVKVLAGRAVAPDMDSLRGMVDLLRDRIGSGVIVLGSTPGNKVNLVTAVTKDLVKSGLHAGKLVKELASVVSGGGGGKAEMAQAGGKDPSRLDEALEKAYRFVDGQIK